MPRGDQNNEPEFKFPVRSVELSRMIWAATYNRYASAWHNWQEMAQEFLRARDDAAQATREALYTYEDDVAFPATAILLFPTCHRDEDPGCRGEHNWPLWFALCRHAHDTLPVSSLRMLMLFSNKYFHTNACRPQKKPTFRTCLCWFFFFFGFSKRIPQKQFPPPPSFLVWNSCRIWLNEEK